MLRQFCPSITFLISVKMAERIELVFGTCYSCLATIHFVIRGLDPAKMGVLPLVTFSQLIAIILAFFVT